MNSAIPPRDYASTPPYIHAWVDSRGIHASSHDGLGRALSDWCDVGQQARNQIVDAWGAAIIVARDPAQRGDAHPLDTFAMTEECERVLGLFLPSEAVEALSLLAIAREVYIEGR